MKTIRLSALLILGAIAVMAQDVDDEKNVVPFTQNKNIPIVKIISGSFDANRNFQRKLAGSGVIIDPRGIIVTSRSVVFPIDSDNEYPELWAGVMDSKRTSLRPNQAHRLKLMNQDKDLNLAILKLETDDPNQTFSAIKFGDTGTLTYGHDLKLTGFMKANGTSLSTADVSFLDFDDQKDLLKIEGQLLKGIAGGAVLDRSGKLIGIPVGARTSDFVPFFNQNNEQIGQISIEEVGLVIPSEAIQGFLLSVPNLLSFTIPSDILKFVSIEGAVTDKESNLPIRLATVGLLMPDSNTRKYINKDQLVAYARTDARGAFKFNRRILPRSYSVKVVHPDYETEYKTINIPTNTSRLLIEMTKEK